MSRPEHPPVELDDPRAMRALAHPARLRILEFLAGAGSATATECSSVVGLSPSACSYHLRSLERRGFVEREASSSDGRERPWRALAVRMSFNAGDSPPGRAASRALESTLRTEWSRVLAEYSHHFDEFPAEWQLAGGADQATLRVSASELAELREKIQKLLRPYTSRTRSGQKVQVLVDYVPSFDPSRKTRPSASRPHP